MKFVNIKRSKKPEVCRYIIKKQFLVMGDVLIGEITIT